MNLNFADTSLGTLSETQTHSEVDFGILDGKSNLTSFQETKFTF